MPATHPPAEPDQHRTRTARKRAWPWLALLSLLWLSTFPAPAQNYSFRAYAQAEGLLGLSISTFYEDRHGVLWVGTELGLHRYERERFHFVGSDAGISSIYIRAITEDSGGNLWVGTSNGLYVRRNGRFENVRWQGQPIQLDNGNTLVAQGDGVVAVSRHRLLRVRPDADGHWQARPLTLRVQGHALPPIGEALLAEGDVLSSAVRHAVVPHPGRWPDDDLERRARPAAGALAKRSCAIVRSAAGCAAATMCCRCRHGHDRSIDHPAPPAAVSLCCPVPPTQHWIRAHGRVVTRANGGMARWEGRFPACLDSLPPHHPIVIGSGLAIMVFLRRPKVSRLSIRWVSGPSASASSKDDFSVAYICVQDIYEMENEDRPCDISNQMIANGELLHSA